MSTEPSEEGGSHAKLILTLQRSPNAKDRAIGLMLAQLKGQRVIADYKLPLNVTANDQETSILQAEQLMLKLDALFSSPSLAKKQN